MNKILIDEATVKLVLGALEHCKDAIVERGLNGNPEFAKRWGLTLPLERSEEAITALKALAEQPAQHTEQPLEMVDAYCKAWEQSFLADNPYHTVQITAADRKHIEAGLKAMLAEQPAQQEPFGYFKAEPFGWTDCAETDEGAVALYTSPQPAQPMHPEIKKMYEDYFDKCFRESSPAQWQKIECPICGDMAIATDIPAAQQEPVPWSQALEGVWAEPDDTTPQPAQQELTNIERHKRNVQKFLAEQPAQQGCMRCNTPKKCALHGCSPLTWPAEQPAELPFGVGGGLVAIKTLLSRDPCVHANTAIQMIDAILAEHPAQQEPVPCCGKYETCTQACTPRGRFLGKREALAKQPAQQEPEQSDIFCGVDFADGMLSVSVLRRRADDVAELLHAEQIEFPAQQEPVAFYRCNGCGRAYEQVHPTSCDCMLGSSFEQVNYYTSPPAQRTWVAVSDRLPLESDGEVLVRMRDGRCEIAWATYWHGASNAFSQWTFRDPDEDEAPTHWMHIPAIEAAHNIKEQK